MTKIEIKLLIDNITPKTIELFFLNNINVIFYKYAGFTWFFIKTVINIIAVDNSISNSLSNRLALINFKTNAVIDSNSENSSSNKKSYLSDDCSSLFNDDHYKDNLDVGSNSKSDINLMVLIKKCIQQQ